jgi:hypothetical protein
LALELVLTFGIINKFYFYTLAGAPNRRELMEPCGQYVFREIPFSQNINAKWAAKVRDLFDC